MQEIKFRAVIADRNTTIFFTLQDLVKPDLPFSIRELLIPWLLEGNQPDRFIGCSDKNGKEIYEGDTVELIRRFYGDPEFGDFKKFISTSYIDEVIYQQGNCQFATRKFKQLLYNDSDHEIEVISSRDENPELLETKNEEKT